MNTPARLGMFGLGLAAVFGISLAAGQVVGPVVGPVGAGAASSHGSAHSEGGAAHSSGSDGAGSDRAGSDGAGSDGAGSDRASSETTAAEMPGGLLVSDRGYTLARVPGAAGELAFQVTGPDGKAVTAYDVQHDERMHLIVVRRDLSGFRHVHPQLGGDGAWRIASPLEGPGTYRAFADFKPAGAEPLTLGIDVTVPGNTQAHPLPAPVTTIEVDGYTVTLDGNLEAGRTSRLTLNLSRDGRPVTDLQPYLGAYGHLVALRDGDLAYLHVHPDGEPGDGRTKAGPGVTFHAEVPTKGTYRLYLDFKHGDTVHTAEFTATAR